MGVNATTIFTPRVVSDGQLPVDGLTIFGTGYENETINEFITSGTGFGDYLYTGLRAINADTGTRYNFINAGTTGSPTWTYFEENERVVEVKAVSTQNITDFASVSGTTHFEDDDLRFTAGDLVLINGQTTTTQNGLYIVREALSGGTGASLQRHPNFNSTSVDVFRKVLVYVNSTSSHEILKKELLRMPCGSGRSDLIWEKDDFIGNGTLQREGTSNENILVTNALRIGTTLTVEGATTLAAVTTGAVTATTLGTSGLATLASASVTGALAVGTTLAVTGNSTLLGSANNVGTITTGVWSGTAISIAKGGTGQVTKTAAFDALSPLTIEGDILIAGTAGTGSRLAAVASGSVLLSAGTSTAPTWGKVALGSAVSGQLPVGNGGTGLASVNQGDILYASGTNTLTRLSKNSSSTRYLSNQGSSNSPSWNQINLADGVTGILPVANGGTGAGNLDNIVQITGEQTITGHKNFTFIKAGYTDGTGSGIKSIDFTLGNVFFWNISGDITLNLTQTQAELAKYVGGSFCVTILNGAETASKVTFSDSCFDTINGDEVTLASGAALSYTGLVLGTTGSEVSRFLYGVIAPASQNLM